MDKVRQMDDWLKTEFLDSLCDSDAILDRQKEHYSDYLAEGERKNCWLETLFTEDLYEAKYA